MTREDQIIVANAIYPVTIDLWNAHYLLEDLRDMFAPEPHKLTDGEAEKLFRVISVASDIVWNSITALCVAAGDKSFQGVQNLLHTAKAIEGVTEHE